MADNGKTGHLALSLEDSIGVLGAGSMGVALAKRLARAGLVPLLGSRYLGVLMATWTSVQEPGT